MATRAQSSIAFDVYFAYTSSLSSMVSRLACLFNTLIILKGVGIGSIGSPGVLSGGVKAELYDGK